MLKVIVAVFALAALVSCEEKIEYSVIGKQGLIKAIGVPATVADDRDYYRQIIERECPRTGICILSFFVGLSSVSYPLSDAAVEAHTAQYNRNPNSGLDRLLLACRLGDIPPNECFTHDN